MGAPVVGIVAREDTSGTWEGFVIYGQGAAYVRSVALAGGAPVLIAPNVGERAWRAVYERLDGLLFAGGVDVDPARYQELPHPQLGAVDDALDEAELMLARWSIADRRPVLAICRGIQLINVAAGGSLYQDLPTQLPAALPHACHPPRYPRDYRAHLVQTEPGSRLAAALGIRRVHVNSRHHQAVKRVAPGFKVVARAPDGVVEGIEHVDAPFIVGVQWHPESMVDNDPHMLALFKAFVDACRR